MKTILFVCTGNVCRSPMAEGIFRHVMKGRRDVQVLSAGIGAMEGQPPSTYAVQAVRELGIDISKQRSRMLTAELVQEADYIFGMTHSHVVTFFLLYPHAAEKTFLLREFDDTLDIFEKDISDPIGGSYDVYLECRDQIEQGIASLLRFLQQGESEQFGGKTASGMQSTEGRTRHMQTRIIPTDLSLRGVDPEIAELIEHERQRQQVNIELIASENFTSP